MSEKPPKKRGLGSVVVPPGPNIVSTWRRIATNNGEKPLTEALGDLNGALGTGYRHDRVAAWEQGSGGRKPSVEVYDYMLGVALPVLLKQQGVGASDAEQITSALRLLR